MTFAKKKTADDYRIPSLAESSPEYADLLQKQADLYAIQTKLNDDRRDIQK
jgi:hypothetical protein